MVSRGVRPGCSWLSRVPVHGTTLPQAIVPTVYRCVLAQDSAMSRRTRTPGYADQLVSTAVLTGLSLVTGRYSGLLSVTGRYARYRRRCVR